MQRSRGGGVRHRVCPGARQPKAGWLLGRVRNFQRGEGRRSVHGSRKSHRRRDANGHRDEVDSEIDRRLPSCSSATSGRAREVRGQCLLKIKLHQRDRRPAREVARILLPYWARILDSGGRSRQPMTVIMHPKCLAGIALAVLPAGAIFRIPSGSRGRGLRYAAHVSPRRQRAPERCHRRRRHRRHRRTAGCVRQSCRQRRNRLRARRHLHGRRRQ